MASKKTAVVINKIGKSKSEGEAVALDGKSPVKVKALPNVKYLLKDESGVAPENATLTRVGDDLQLTLEGETTPALILEGYFSLAEPPGLFGVAEDGQLYAYGRTDGAGAIFSLADGGMTAVALAGDPVAAGAADSDDGNYGAFWPLLMFGGLAAGGIAASSRGSSSGLVALPEEVKPEPEPAKVIPAPKQAGAIDNVGTITGPILDKGFTDDTRPEFFGQGTPGNTITISDHGKVIGEVVVDGNGNWTLTPTEEIGEGPHSITITETDNAGNKSEPSDPLEFGVDLTPPGKPGVGGAIDNFGTIVGPILSGGVTDDSRPEFFGNGEPGSTITIYDKSNVVLGTAVVDGDGNWTFSLEGQSGALEDGQHSITITATDKAGNTSEPSDPFVFEVDTMKPAAPDVHIDGAIDETGLISTDKPMLSGKGEPGDTIVVTYPDGQTSETTVRPDGTWTAPAPAKPLPEGGGNIVVKETDGAGNSAVVNVPVIVDTLPPAAPEIGSVLDDVAPYEGELQSGQSTNDTQPTLSGTAEPGSKVTVTDNGKVIGTVDTDPGTGEWTFTPKDPLDEGEHIFEIKATDAAGNTSAGSQFVVDVDTTKPTKPGVGEGQGLESAIDNVGEITGSIPKGGDTDDAQPEFTGNGEPGHTITVSDNGKVIGEVVVKGDGTWSLTPTEDLAEGPHSITITETDKAGNTSEPSDPFVFEVDTATPTKPGVGEGQGLESAIDNVGEITGSIPKGGDTDDAKPEFTGNGKPGNTITVSDNGKVIGQVVVKGDGTWTLTPTEDLAEGSHSITITETSKAGKESEPSDPFEFEVDLTAPDASRLAITGVEDDVGEVLGNVASGATTDDSRPLIRGTGTAGDTIIVMVKDGLGSRELGRATVDADGKWSLQVQTALAGGVNEFTAIEMDPAGNKTSPSNPYAVTVDTGRPEVPVIDNVQDDKGVVHMLQKGEVTNDATPTIFGTAQAGNTVRIYDGATQLGEVKADANGKWSFTPGVDLAEGAHNLTATATSPVGQTSDATGIWNFVVDTKAPDAVSGLQVKDDVGAKQGPLSNNETTDDSTPTFSGKAEPGSKVSVYDGATKLGEADVDGNGDWSFTPGKALDDGPHSFTTKVTDPAGNESASSEPVNVTVDTSGVVVSITQVKDNVGSVTGNITPNGVTDETRPEIVGSGKAGSTITVYDGANVLGTTTVQANGTWSFTPTVDLGQGAHSITAQAEDLTGTKSDPTPAFVFRVDTVAPLAPTIGAVTDDVGEVQGALLNGATTDDPSPTLRGKAEAGSTVTVYDGGTPLGSVRADANGDWSYTPTTGLSQGLHEFTVKATDAAGNTSAESDKFTLTTDYTAPDATKLAITGVEDDVGEVLGNVAPGATTDDSRPEIRGTGTAGDTIIVMVKANGEAVSRELGRAKVGEDGKWSLQVQSPLAGGVNEFTAIEMDPAGNKTNPSTPYAVTVDTGRPEVPVIDNVQDDKGVVHMLQKGEVTNDATPTIFGTAQAGNTVRIYDGATQLGEVKADANGKWSFTPGVDLAEGAHNLTATATSPVGQTSDATGIWNFVVDTKAPDAVSGLQVKDDVGAKQGPLSNNETTDDSTPTFSGKAEPGSKVSVYDGATKLGEADVDGNGDWSFTPGKALDDGPHSFTTKVTDPAGNESAASEPVNVTVDTSGVAVSITQVKDEAGSVTGNITPNGVTDETRPEIVGSGKAGSTITVYDGANVLGTTTVQANGTWSFKPTVDLGQGEHSITAQAEDLTGTKSDPTPAFVFRVDTVAPLAPTIGAVTDDVGEVQGALLNGATTDDPSPTLRGKAEAGSTVTVYDGGTPLGSVRADANGDWSYTPTTGLSQGLHEFTVKATDTAGNTSAESDKFTLTTDYTAPDATKLAITGVEDDVGEVLGNVAPGATTDDSRPEIRGTGTAGDTIIVMVKANGEAVSRELGRAKVGEDGKWSLQVQSPLAGGVNEFTAIEMDPAGNKTNPSTPYAVTFDDSVPGSSIVITSISDDTGPSANDFVTSDTSLTINGTLTQALGSGQRAQITVDGGRSWQDVVVSGASWSYVDSRTLSDGQYDYTVRVISAAGVASAVDQKTVTIDTQGPTNRTTVDLAVESDWGLSNTDNITANVTPTINGKVGAGSDADLSKLRVTLFDDVNNDGRLDAGDRVFSSSISVAADGSWSYDLPSLRDGSYRLKALVTDQAGNASSAVSTLDGNGARLVIDSKSVGQTIRGSGADDHLGYDVTNIGDFNGDGYDDLMVSAPSVDFPGAADAGAAYILYGSASGVALVGDYINKLTPQQGLKIYGATPRQEANDQMGLAINYLGDINGDGYDDALIASSMNDKAYVVFGGANGSWANGTLNLAAIDQGQNQYGFKVALPVNQNSTFAKGVGSADINGDGYADLLLGNFSDGTSGWRGTGTVIYGHGGNWSNIQMVLKGDTWSLPSGVLGTTIVSAGSGPYANLDLGWTINGVGDVNGDGIEDFVITDPTGSNPMVGNTDAGSAVLIYGNKDGLPATLDLSRLTPSQGIHINSMAQEWLGAPESHNDSANTVARLGDINGDGIDDFAISTAHSEPGNPGRVWVIYGKQGGYGKDINLDAMFTSGTSGRPNGYTPTFTAADGFLLVNEKSTATSQSSADEFFGGSIRGMGDVNGDGINDFIIGASRADGNGLTDNGAAYVVYGRSDNFEAPVISIKDIMNDPSKGYVLRGANEWGGWDRFGSGVTIGDWNGDGVADVAVGAMWADNIGATTSNNGALYIYYGTPNFTQEYTTGDDVLVGTGAVDFLAGGLGNDTISQIGTKDVALGGAGNDTIRIIGTDFMNVDGGVGIDTLVMDGKGMSLDLTALKSKVKGFEHFDLGSDGGNTLAVHMSDITRLGQANVLVSDGKTQLVVHGDATGQVNLVNAGAAADRWTDAGTKTVDGSVYHAYTNVAGTSELLVEDRVHVTIL